MGKLTRFARRLLRPLVMVGIVGTLSVSLVVTTPSNAQAFVVPPIPPPVIAGAVEALAPAAWAAAVTPAGWVILGGVALLAGAYYTKDYWLPYVQGAFGQGTPDQNTNVPPSGTGLNIDPRIHNNGVSWNINANGVKVGAFVDLVINGAGAPATNNYEVTYRKWCETPSGSVYMQDAQIDAPSINTYYTPTQYLTPRLTIDACRVAADKIVGVKAGPAKGDGDLWKANGQKGPDTVSFIGRKTTDTAHFDPASPDVKYTTTVECIRKDGTKFSLSADSSGDAKGVKMPSCAASVPGSHGTGKTTVDGFAPNTTTPQRLYDLPANTPATNQPLCGGTRPGQGCKLSIAVDGKPCVVGDFNCVNWLDISKQDLTRVQCSYGPYAVGLDSCNGLERAYEEGGAPATQENTDGNPATRNDNDPAGQPVQNPTTTTTTVPGGAAPAPPPGSTTEQAQCFPSGWATLNPVEWVMKPVGCALDSAFKPKKDIQTRLTGMQTKFSGKVPVSWFTGGTANVSGGSCPTNWALDVQGQHVSLICGTPVEGILLAFRPVMGAMLVIAALWPLLRSLFYAAIPILKVNPS